jgi:hypothetical protein
MRNRRCMLALTITGIFVAALMLCASESLSGSPPPGDSHFQGPAIRGQFIFEDNTGEISVSFLGTCGKADLKYEGPLPSDIDYDEDITEDNLKDNMIPWDQLPLPTDDCYPPAFDKGDLPDGLVVIQVKDFNESGGQKFVEVIMLWAVPQ